MSCKILIVEDYELTSKFLSELFKAVGFEVDVISDGSKVLPYLENNRVDIMTLDLELPGMTGDKIHLAMQNNSKFKDIPIINFTSHREFNSPGSLPHNLMAQGKRPQDVILKEDLDDIEKPGGLLDIVLIKLTEAKKNIPQEMTDYFMKTRKQTVEQVIKLAHLY
jgi:CheY-like chemotaxis protein